MIELRVDYNERELLRDGVQTIVVELGDWNVGIHREDLREGMRVVLSDGELQCEAVLRHGKDYEWVADIVPGTSIDLFKG